MEDSFRGTCINCGMPQSPGNPCIQCQAALSAMVKSQPTYSREWSKRYTHRGNYFPTKKEEKSMATIQICERCGSIGQAKDFVSVDACTMNGDTLVFPEVSSLKQWEKLHKDDMEEAPSTNFTMCRNCKSDFVDFLNNRDIGSRSAQPIQPRLNGPKEVPPTSNM